MRFSRSFLLLMFVFSASAFVSAAHANGPRVADPLAPLNVRDDAESKKLQKEAQSSFMKAYKAVLKLEQQVAEGKAKSIRPSEVGDKVNAPNRDLDRAANRLIQRGETAGTEYKHRSQLLKDRMTLVIMARMEAGKLGKTVSVNRMRALAKKYRKRLATIKKNFVRKKLEPADADMHKLMKILTEVSIWFSGDRTKSAYKPYLDFNHQLTVAVSKYRKAQTVADLRQQREQLLPDFEGTLRDLRSAASSVGSTGTVSFEGTSLSGPEWLLRFNDRLTQIQLDALQCRGLDLGRRAVGDNKSLRDLSDLADMLQQFRIDAFDGIANLIGEDARRASGSDATQLYGDYVRALAVFVAPGNDPALLEATNSALNQLASTSPELQSEVESYRWATSDLLRWRERVASKVAAASGAQHAELGPTLVGGATAEKGPIRFYSPHAPSRDAKLYAEAQRSVTYIGGWLLTKAMNVRVSNLLTARDGSGHATSQHRNGAYAHFENDFDLSGIIDALRFSLLVNDAAPPLTVEAAAAIDSAVRGDFAEVGGTITEMELEGYAPKLATLATADWGLASDIPKPDNQVKSAPIQILFIRCELEPEWLRHKYFYVSKE